MALSSTTHSYSADVENNYRIRFSQPALEELIQKYTVVDMHFHSRHSDGFNDIPAIVERARKLNIGLAMTDHNAIAGALEIAKYSDVFSIPGIEITSKEGAHLLVYFYRVDDLVNFFDRDLQPYLGKETMSSTGLTMETLVACARQYRSLVVFPHPYCAAYTGVCNPVFSQPRQESLLSMADGLEVINAGNIHKWNLESAVLGFNMNIGLTGGSDGHNLFQLGRAVTYAACEKTPAAFLNAILERRTWVMGKEVNILRKVTSNGMKLRTNIRNSSDLVGKNMRYGYAVINHKSQRVRNRMKQRKISRQLGRQDV